MTNIIQPAGYFSRNVKSNGLILPKKKTKPVKSIPPPVAPPTKEGRFRLKVAFGKLYNNHFVGGFFDGVNITEIYNEAKKWKGIRMVKWPVALRFKMQVLGMLQCNGKVILDSKKIMINNTCDRRFCPMCGKKRSALFCMQYLPVLLALHKDKGKILNEKEGSIFPGLYFVTLTVKNCTEEELPAVLEKMRADWRNILKYKHKGILTHFSGIRKFECHPCAPNPWKCHNEIEKEEKRKKPSIRRLKNLRENLRLAEAGIWTYHPHYHLLILKRDNARFIARKWLIDNPTASRLAQKIKPFEEGSGSALELSKYISKPLQDPKSLVPGIVYSKKLGVLHRLLMGKPSFHAFGECKKSNHDEHVTAEIEASVMEGLKEEANKVGYTPQKRATDGAYEFAKKVINFIKTEEFVSLNTGEVKQKKTNLFEKKTFNINDKAHINQKKAAEYLKLVSKEHRETQRQKRLKKINTTVKKLVDAKINICNRCKETAENCFCTLAFRGARTKNDIARSDYMKELKKSARLEKDEIKKAKILDELETAKIKKW